MKRYIIKRGKKIGVKFNDVHLKFEGNFFNLVNFTVKLKGRVDEIDLSYNVIRSIAERSNFSLCLLHTLSQMAYKRKCQLGTVKHLYKGKQTRRRNKKSDSLVGKAKGVNTNIKRIMQEVKFEKQYS